MNSIRLLALVLILAVMLCRHAHAAEPLMLYVAPDGNDAWSGSLEASNADSSDGPLATIEAARDAIRGMRTKGPPAAPVRVLVREGVYRVAAPIVFGPEDSGGVGAPVTYAAYPGEEPVVSGGRRITAWRQEGDLWCVELPEVKAGQWHFGALWVDGDHLRPARSPNEGFFLTAGKAPKLTNPDTGEEIDRSKLAFRYDPNDVSRWENLEDAVFVVYHSWDTSYGRVAELDEANHTVTFKTAAHWPFENWGPKQRYFVENVFEALDRPGEWYLNRKTGVLYYWPREGESMDATEVIAPVAEQLVRFEGDLEAGRFVEHLRLEGLSFQHTDFPIPPEGMPDHQAAYSVPGAIQAEGARHCAIEDCEVARISNYAIWFHRGCQDNRVVRNHVHDLGAGGVRIGDGGDPANEHAVTKRNVVDNNWIHDGGKIFPAAVGVWIGRSSYNTVSHNEISDFFYTGVSVGWSWGYAASSANHNIIEYNHIHHLGKWVLSDMGGIYTLGVAPGTILRHNHIHDVHSFAYGGWGIYPDEGSTDLLIENNVVYDTKTGGFHQHYGKENRVQNNIFAFSLEGQVQRSREEEHISFFFERNIVLYNNGQLLGSRWANGNFSLDHNCYWDTSGDEVDFAGRTLEEWQAAGHDEHSIVADPLFVDPEAGDFRLKADSPALALGFQPIDLSEVGLYGEPEWVDKPKQIPREPFSPPPLPEPTTIADGFEDTPVGSPAAGASTLGEEGEARIRVSDETAASGAHSLKFVDRPGLKFAFNPHLVYHPHMRNGVVAGTFAVRLEPGAHFYHEWRDSKSPYTVGPSIWIDPAGALTVQGQPLATVPHGQWIRLEVACGLGREATGAFDLTVTLPGQEPQRFEGLACGNPAFRRLDWWGFVSNADAAVTVYLDDVSLNTR